MAQVSIHKYFTAFLVMGVRNIELTTHKIITNIKFPNTTQVVCSHADDTENPKMDMEMLESRNQLLDSMFEDAVELTNYTFDMSKKVCDKLLDEEIYKNENSEELDTREMIHRNCVIRVVHRLDPTAIRRGDHLDDIMLSKYGFEYIRKIVDRKYEDFYKEIVQGINDYVKALTPEQRRKTTARNLKRWSRKIKNAPTLAEKEFAFRKCMRFYYFEGGV